MQSIPLNAEEIIEKYAPIVKKQMKKLNIYKDFDDYYQVGLIALWEAYERYNPEKGSFATFAIFTVRGRLLTMLQKEKSYTDKHHITEDGFHQMIDNHTAIPLEKEIIESYIEGLPPRQQTWVREVIIYNKSTAEIAKQYGVHENTVRVWKQGLAKNVKALQR
ncbi:hypothetical protein BTR23_10265 [Alkalihalophilus pseudofirmus]|nr:hypothetical protein BTR23_10265 [Alkalihalophilus pseudofirmus]